MLLQSQGPGLTNQIIPWQACLICESPAALVRDIRITVEEYVFLLLSVVPPPSQQLHYHSLSLCSLGVAGTLKSKNFRLRLSDW
jgi:hypothetical protein